MITAMLDERTGIIRCRSGGFKSPADIKEDYATLKRLVDRSHQRFGRARVLILTENPIVQSSETVSTVHDTWVELGPDDRMAIVIPAGLAKLQASRNFLSDTTRAFTEEAVAVAWLSES